MQSSLTFVCSVLMWVSGLLIGLGCERKKSKANFTSILLQNGKAHYEVNATTGETTLIVNPEFEIVSSFANK